MSDPKTKNFKGQGFTRNFLRLMKQLEQQKECCANFLTGINTEDTLSVHFLGDGTKIHPLEANVQISTTAGNILSINSTGLYVPPPSGGVMADNGLSITGGFVQLGQAVGALGDPGALIQNTEIPFGGNTLSFIDRGTGNSIKFNPQGDVITNIVNGTDWSGFNPGLEVQNTNSIGIFQGFNDVGIGGDFLQVGLNSIGTGHIAYLNFLSSGNIMVKNQTSPSPGDLGFLLQVLGGVVISNTTPGSGDCLDIVPTVSPSTNYLTTNVDTNGFYFLNSLYNGTNGGLFRGDFNLIQNINFNSPSESQQAFNSNVNVNWNNNVIGNASIISFNEFQVQMNLNAIGDPNPAQMTIGTTASYYGAAVWVYRGMNPLGGDGTGNLQINSSGTQSGGERPLPLGDFVSRIDFNNGNTVNVSGTMAGFVSDIRLGAPGSLDNLIDYSAGNISDDTSGGFTITKRFGFYVNDLMTGVGVTQGYPFYSLGPSDISWIAGITILGGANATPSGGYPLQIKTQQNSNIAGISITGNSNTDILQIAFIDSSSAFHNWLIQTADTSESGSFVIRDTTSTLRRFEITDGGIFNIEGRNNFPTAGNDFNVGGSIEAFLNLPLTASSWATVMGTDTSGYDTTASPLISYGGKFISSGLRGAGANPLISIGVYGNSTGTAQENFSAVFENANVQIKGSGAASLTDNGAAIQVQGNQSLGATSTNAGGTTTLDASATIWSFTGTTGTFKLPALTGKTGWYYFIKNRGSGNLTLQSNAGGNDIYNTSAVSSITIAAGAAARIFHDGTFWCVE